MVINSQAAMAIALFASIASVCWSAAYAWAKWLQHKGAREIPGITERLEQIERAIDTVAVEVERLGERQRFTESLLRDANSPKGSARPLDAHRVNTPH